MLERNLKAFDRQLACFHSCCKGIAKHKGIPATDVSLGFKQQAEGGSKDNILAASDKVLSKSTCIYLCQRNTGVCFGQFYEFIQMKMPILYEQMKYFRDKGEICYPEENSFMTLAYHKHNPEIGKHVRLFMQHGINSITGNERIGKRKNGSFYLVTPTPVIKHKQVDQVDEGVQIKEESKYIVVKEEPKVQEVKKIYMVDEGIQMTQSKVVTTKNRNYSEEVSRSIC